MFTNLLYFYKMNFTTRQVEIIEASKYLIGKKGIQNLTIKNLAKKMSFSEPAIYRHFKDKTEILKALLLFHREIFKSELISGSPILSSVKFMVAPNNSKHPNNTSSAKPRSKNE